MSGNDRRESMINFVSVQIFNVEFKSIVVDSNLNRLLSKLKVAFNELDSILRFDMPLDAFMSKAIEVNSTVKVLMGSVDENESARREEFSSDLIASCAAIVERYKVAEGKFSIGDMLSKELIGACDVFFKERFGSIIDGDFWFDLSYYEWLLKEGFVYNRMRRGLYDNCRELERYNSDESLEEFFVEYRSEILKRMIKEDRRDGHKLDVSSPLSRSKVFVGFKAYKNLP